jgi:hypothetical protein
MRQAGSIMYDSCVQNFSWKTSNKLADLATDGRIILKFGRRIWDIRLCIEFIWFRLGPVTGFFKHSNEFSVSIKDGFLIN